MELSATISEHVARLGPADLPPATVRATKRALLDTIGVMLAATDLSEEVQPFSDIAESEGGAAEATLLRSGRKVPAPLAAFANGALGHALDFGDTYDAGTAHPSAALVPALLALAEANRSIDGARFLAAMAIGSDLCCRLSLASLVPLEDRGWYPPPLFGTLGAAAGCANLLGLTPAETRAALSLAMCQVSFPGEIKYDAASHVRAIREAFAARAAVTAARLAAGGVRGFERPLEGKAGFFALYAPDGYDSAPLVNGLGETFLGDRVSFKPWPSCRGTHAYIQAALALAEQFDLSPERIERMVVTIGPVQEMLVYPAETKAAPLTAIDAKFSIPFTVATALVHHAVTLDSFSADALRDSNVLQLARKIEAQRDPSWDRSHAASGRLEITCLDGAVHVADVPQAAGHPDEPISDQHLIEKFVACAARAARPLSRPDALGLADRIMHLEALERVDQLVGDTGSASPNRAGRP